METRRGPAATAVSTVSQFLAGAQLLGRGFAMYARSPALLALGIIPAAITGVLFVAALAVLLFFISDLAELATGFAGDWPEGVRDVTRFVAAAGILGVAGLVGVLTFTALTLLIGDPFYEKISEKVEDRFGGVPDEAEVPGWRALGRNAAESAKLVALSVMVGVPLFLAGFIPGAGQTVIPVIGAFAGGWFLAVELTGVPFARRGLRLSDRRERLSANRPMALGFGVSVFLLFLVPFGAVLVMPAAVAGGTLLARHVLSPPDRRPDNRPERGV